MIEAKQIDWSLVPDWAEYVAMDENGRAWGYRNEPVAMEKSWASDSTINANRVFKLDNYIDRNQWRSSLVRRPVEYAANPEPDMSACVDDEFDELPIGDDLSDMAPKNWPGDVTITVGGEEVDAPTPEFNAWMEKEQEKFNEVTRPSHYVIKDGVEVIDVREWWLQCIADYQIEPMRMHDPDVIDGLETISHLERAMEYLLRAPGKNGMEDVRKAYQYLHRALHGEWPK